MDKERIEREWKEGRLVAPSVNILEEKDHYLMEAHMPGVNKDGIELMLAEGKLTVYGHVENRREKDCCFLVREAEEGNFYRVFRIGEMIDVNKISAKIEHGVLTVTLPKHDRVKPKEIPVQIE